jgi:tRNA G18 (ribose-2'-O)-methylase SpoU
MRIIEIDSIDREEVAVFASLTEAELRNRLHPERGIFIAESPKVIDVALRAGYEPISLLCERRHISGDAADIIARCGDIPVYTGERETLARLTGYTLTRGVLCAMRRRAFPSVEEVCRDAHRVVLIDSVTDTTNIGAIFRSAAALGIDAVLLTPSTCDPLNRRAVRVSMGSVFLVPWTWLPVDSLAPLKELGFTTVAMALCNDSVSIESPELRKIPRMAIVMGTEGDGLSRSRIDETDITVKIPMSHGVDSLNVAAASAVAFYALKYEK